MRGCLLISVTEVFFFLFLNTPYAQSSGERQKYQPQAVQNDTLSAGVIYDYVEACTKATQTDTQEATNTLQLYLNGQLPSVQLPSGGPNDCRASCIVTCCPNFKCDTVKLMNCLKPCPR